MDGGLDDDWTVLQVGNGIGPKVPSMTKPIAPNAVPDGWVAPAKADAKPAATTPAAKPAATTPGAKPAALGNPATRYA